MMKQFRCVALSCVKGGASVIRMNLEHVKAIKETVKMFLLLELKKYIKETIR